MDRMFRPRRGLASALLLSMATACAGPSPPSVSAGALRAAGAQALAPDVFLLRGSHSPPRQPDGNSLMIAGADGWLVVDSGRHAEHAARLRTVSEASGAPVRILVNTHWHLDHVGNNPALRTAWPGLRVLGSPAIDGALSGFLSDYRKQLQGLVDQAGPDAPRADWEAELARIDAGPALRPDEAITADAERVLAGRRVRIGHEADAVTGGDLWLYDPASGVLAAGDLVTLPAPFFDTACPTRWSAALERLDAVPFTQLVPGHGAPMTRADFGVYRTAYDRLLACAAGPADAEACIAGWLADAGPLLAGSEAPAQARSLLAYYLAVVLRGPQPLRHCGAADEPRPAEAAVA